MKKLATIALTIALMGTAANAAFLDDGGAMGAHVTMIGELIITNTTGAPLPFDGYAIYTHGGFEMLPSGAAGPTATGWNSISDYITPFDMANMLFATGELGGDIMSFGEAQNRIDFMAELNVTTGGQALLQPGASWSMGVIAPGAKKNNLEFRYSQPGVTGEFKVEITYEGGVSTEIQTPTEDMHPGGPWNNHGQPTGDPPYGRNEAHVGPFGSGHQGGFYGIHLNGLGEGGTGIPGGHPYQWSIRTFDPNDGLPETVIVTIDDTDDNGAVDKYFLTFAELASIGVLDRTGTIPYILTLDALDETGAVTGDGSEIIITIPEPATMGLMLLGSLALVGRKRRS